MVSLFSKILHGLVSLLIHHVSVVRCFDHMHAKIYFANANANIYTSTVFCYDKLSMKRHEKV